ANLSGKHLMCTCFWKAVSSAVPPSPGSHSLHYNLTVLSRDGSVQPSFFAGGHLDGQAFLHCDRETGRVEPRGLWAEELGAETWDTESKDLTETWKDLRKLLAEILALQEEKGVVGSDLGHGNGEVRGHRWLSKQVLLGPRAGRALWKTAGLSGILDRLQGENRYCSWTRALPLPRPLEPPRHDSAHRDPPCPLGAYMLCWRGVLQFPALLNPYRKMGRWGGE
uniref:MHC class I-like antigen recognition-like domain-containing protein n=1 Tax=Balaenoptera musculus TaxID=9771 RepID=A0A8C0DFP6_BALMU